MPTYLDHNATTPLDERVLEAMLPFLREGFGNPSSLHGFGRPARDAVEAAREQVAALVGAHPSQVVFTGGGTEANNAALKGVAERSGRRRVAVSAVEHASVLEPAAGLARRGWAVDTLAVDAAGRVRPEALAGLDADTALVSVMAANNETGTVQDLAAVSAAAREHGAVVHTDAVQAAGKIELGFAASGAHLMSLSAHKLYGPKGVGALVVDKAVDWTPLLQGGGQERGRRAGTENVAAIVGFGRAAELARTELAANRQHLEALRGRLLARLAEALPEAVVLSPEAQRLPNTVMLALPGLDGETLLMGLDGQGFAVSSGAACGSAKDEPSHVLAAMGVPEEWAQCSLRVSLGRGNSEADVDAFVAALKQQARTLSRMAAATAWA